MSETTYPGLKLRFATVHHSSSGQQLQWKLSRNCSVTPAQLGLLYASLCIVSLSIAGMFWLHGAKLVMPFAWLELFVVGTAFFIYARHATDGERIWLSGDELVVELTRAGHVSVEAFKRAWVRVEPVADDRSLIELSSGARKIHIGRHLRPELRPELAREIRSALRTA
jgi:uncharacterized membrane protein